MRTIVITGGAGFVGSHLCEYYLGQNFNVWCVDNLSTGRIKNIEHLGNNEKFHFLKMDVSEKILIPSDVDFVMHFASPASPPAYAKLPIETLKVGSYGTINALGLSKEKSATFLLASTSEVYGSPTIHPQVENYNGNVNCIGPRSMYDESKRFAEAATMAYHTFHGVDTKIVRIFNCFGPRLDVNDGRALSNFICQALRNEDITVYGDGMQTRSFQYVSDLVDGVNRLILSNYHYPVNIGNPDEIALIEVAKEVIKLIGSKSKIVYLPLPKDDPKVRKPDITLAKEKLKWKPKVSREEGLIKTIEYFKRELDL